MKRIELFERAIAEKARNLKDYGINSSMFWAYRKSMEAGNDSIDFGEVIWDEVIEAITECMKEKGITVYSISSTFCSLIPILGALEKHGSTLDGLTELNAK